MDAMKLREAQEYALTGGGSGCVVRSGRLVLAWGDQAARYDLKSSTKSFGTAALGLAIKDGKARLDDPAVKLHPTFAVPPESNRTTGWIERITLRQLASQMAGFDKPGGFGPLLFAPRSTPLIALVPPASAPQTARAGRWLQQLIFPRRSGRSPRNTAFGLALTSR